MTIKYLTTLMLLGWLIQSQAQSCPSPAQLCAEEAASIDEITLPDAVDFGCMDVSNTYFYQFTTNSIVNTGTAMVNIDNISCPGIVNSDTLYSMIIQPPAVGLGDPCDPANWSQIGDCQSDTLTIEMETPDLEPNTTYYLVVGSNQPINQMTCQFEVTISGSAVDINACCDNQISLGEASELTVLGGDTPPGYTWDPPSWLDDANLESPTAYPEETITYQVIGSVGDCIVTDLVTVFVGPPISVVNTFTPNGDGINDTWEIAGISQFTNVQVNVFDRWGQPVYNELGYAQEWDGTNNGKFLPSATYYFVIELNSLDVNIPPVTGHVTIIH